MLDEDKNSTEDDVCWVKIGKDASRAACSKLDAEDKYDGKEILLVWDKAPIMEYYKDSAARRQKIKDLYPDFVDIKDIVGGYNNVGICIEEYYTKKYWCRVLSVKLTYYRNAVFYASYAEDGHLELNYYLCGKISHKTVHLLFYEVGDVLYESQSYQSKGGKFFPITLKVLSSLPYCIKKAIFSYMCDKSPVWMQLLHYKALPPIPISKVNGVRNCQELIEKVFGITLPETPYKNNFLHMYAACCAYSYVKDEDRYLLFSAPWISERNVRENCLFYADETDIALFKNRKKLSAIYLKIYYENAFKEKYDLCYYDKALINAYVELSVKKKKKISLLYSKEELTRARDELELIDYKKTKLNIPKNTLSALKLPKEFSRITSATQLFWESRTNDTYVEDKIKEINVGKCLIYTAEINGEHAAIEIVYNEKAGYRVKRCTSAGGGRCDNKTVKYIKETVKEYGKKVKSPKEKKE